MKRIRYAAIGIIATVIVLLAYSDVQQRDEQNVPEWIGQ